MIRGARERYPLRVYGKEKVSPYRIQLATGETMYVRKSTTLTRFTTQQVKTIARNVPSGNMFVVFATLIDALSSAICIIDDYNKPFGTDLPVEVQNRIMWWTKHAEHLDRVTKVHKELKSRRVCGLTDWLRIPKTYERFHKQGDSDCQCERCDPEPLCHWCSLYADKYLSVEFRVLESKLQRLRDNMGMYDADKYRQFITDYLPVFRNVLLFTASTIILPMLTYMDPGRYHFNYKKIPPTASFPSVSVAHIFLVDGMIRETRATRFRNPAEMREFAFAIARKRNTRAKKRKVEKEGQ